MCCTSAPPSKLLPSLKNCSKRKQLVNLVHEFLSVFLLVLAEHLHKVILSFSRLVCYPTFSKSCSSEMLAHSNSTHAVGCLLSKSCSKRVMKK